MDDGGDRAARPDEVRERLALPVATGQRLRALWRSAPSVAVWSRRATLRLGSPGVGAGSPTPDVRVGAAGARAPAPGAGAAWARLARAHRPGDGRAGLLVLGLVGRLDLRDRVGLGLVERLAAPAARGRARRGAARSRSSSATTSSSASSTIRRTSSSTSCWVAVEVGCAPGSSGLVLRPSATATGPIASLMPQRPTMPRAIWVSCWMSDSAPVVMLPVDDLLGGAAAERDLDLADAAPRARSRSGRPPGVESVTPSACPRGMIEIFRTGSAPGVSIPTQRVAGLVVGGALAVGVGS